MLVDIYLRKKEYEMKAKKDKSMCNSRKGAPSGLSIAKEHREGRSSPLSWTMSRIGDANSTTQSRLSQNTILNHFVGYGVSETSGQNFCTQCNVTFLIGSVFYCTTCEDYSLCQHCYNRKDEIHPSQHRFVEEKEDGRGAYKRRGSLARSEINRYSPNRFKDYI